MSEKSFAVISVAAAVVCGVFFYPPPPPERAQQVSRAVLNPVPAAQSARAQDSAVVERTWWRARLAQLKPSSSLHP